MTQNASDVEIANQGFAAFRQDLNDVLEDITTLHSGDTAPTTTYANQFWYETDTDKLYIRNEDNDAWIEILTLDQANDHLATLGASITLDGTGNVSIDSGDFTVDTDTLHVDSTNNRVGIGTDLPGTPLEVLSSTPYLTLNYSGGTGTSSRATIIGENDDGTTWSLGGVTGSGHLSLTNAKNANMYFGTNNSTRMTISSIGGVSIAASSGNGYLSVPQAYAGTTSSSVNMHILSSGVFLRSVSSGRYKTGVEDAEMSYAEELYNLRPVYYKSLGTFDNPNHGHWGFIAEEVAQIDPRLCLFKTTEPDLDEDGNVQYDDDGNIVETTLDEPVVEGVQYDRIVPLLLMLLKAEKEKVETLETKVATLETQATDFETRIAALESA